MYSSENVILLCVFQELDLSNNYLDNLPAGLFRDMSNLTRLTLHNNSLTVMDRELFQVAANNYTTPYLEQSIVQLTNKALTLFFVCHVMCEIHHQISQSANIQTQPLIHCFNSWVRLCLGAEPT